MVLYDEDPGTAYAKKMWESSSDWVARFFRLLLLIFAFVSLIFSYLTVFSCNVLRYQFPQPIGGGDQSNINNSSPQDVDSSAWDENPSTIGFYKHNPTGLFCVKYDSDDLEKTTSLRLARFFGVLGALLGSLALLLLLVEFLCCRFWCSRFLIILLLLLATITQGCTFIIFLDERCGGRDGLKYLCDLDVGGVYSLVATILFLVTSCLTCPTPKALPVLRVVRDMEKVSVVDPCCCCSGKSRDDIIEEQATLIERIGGVDEEVTINGVEYKQWHDSKAGLTLQDQYTAAYEKWVHCEEIYDRTLDRFKNECDAAGLSWRTVKKMEADEIKDDDIRRLVLLLTNLARKSERAQDDLERCEAELESAIGSSMPEVFEKDLTGSSTRFGKEVQEVGQQPSLKEPEQPSITGSLVAQQE